MKIVLLDAKTLGDDLDLSPIRALGELEIHQTTSYDETLERIKEADIVITNKVIIDQAIMDQCPNLKLICIAATGMNNVDLEYAASKDIAVKNVAGYSTQSVVQHTFTMALYLLEKMGYYSQVAPSRAWSDSKLFTDVSKPFFEISGKKWGIIGLGSIGQEVAKVATAFGAKVCYYSTSGKNNNSTYPQLALDELLSSCEIISIHAPLNEATQYLLNQNNLNLIQEGSILLNLGRGGIIDEGDLASILDQKNIYAGLDVVEKEPIPNDNPLLNIQNQERLLITPHIAWTSKEARIKLLDGIANNIKSFVNP
ncbi:MAG: D-2-hydroxyacid dehydrogenase [Campylobacterota bacterium]|nr:D-2-hydroxyacid dehydrogenase [Campylobacterota bacterium]